MRMFFFSHHYKPNLQDAPAVVISEVAVDSMCAIVYDAGLILGLQIFTGEGGAKIAVFSLASRVKSFFTRRTHGIVFNRIHHVA